MARTGINNKITEVRYYKIKAATKVPSDDKKSMEDFGIGASTCRKIRNTKDYAEYVASNRKRCCAHKNKMDDIRYNINKFDNEFVNNLIKAVRVRISLIVAILLFVFSLFILVVTVMVRG